MAGGDTLQVVPEAVADDGVFAMRFEVSFDSSRTGLKAPREAILTNAKCSRLGEY